LTGFPCDASRHHATKLAIIPHSNRWGTCPARAWFPAAPPERIEYRRAMGILPMSRSIPDAGRLFAPPGKIFPDFCFPGLDQIGMKNP